MIGGALALLLAAGSPAQAGLPDAAWLSAFPQPSTPAARPLVPSMPVSAAVAPVPVVVFKGLSLKSIQFSRTDRIPVALVAAIDRTEKTLLLALYDLGLSEVGDALLRAKARGVEIRLVYDKSHTKGASPEYQALLAAGVPTRVLKGGGSFGIMHHKYAVFDGELLMTGSFNWTRSADTKHYENVVFKMDPALIDGYTRNWEWMWSLGDDFGAPPADTSKPVRFAGGKYPRYVFSPQGGVADMLIDALGRAKRTIDVAMFSFYSQDVADAMIAAKARGVIVRIAADSSQARRSQALLALSNAKVPLRLSRGREGQGLLHHKYVIIDGKLLMSGSYNFSANAELFNFENDLITVERGEVAAFGGEFALIWEQAHVPDPSELPDPKSL